MRSLLIHAGLPKTATTAIQGAMYGARQSLIETDKLLYPELCRGNRNEIGRIFSKNPEKNITNKIANLKRPIDALKHQSEGLASLSDEFRRPGWARAIISAEAISNLRQDELELLRDWARSYVDDITILFWVREPVALVTSVVQQILKAGLTQDKLFAALPLPIFKRAISNAIAVFGRDKIRVEAFESAVSAQGGVVAEFARQVGLSEAGTHAITGSATLANESFSHEAALMLDHLNTVRPLFAETGGRHLGREITTFRDIKGGKFHLPLEIRRSIHERTREEVDWLNETFGLALYRGAFDDKPDPPSATSTETIASTALVMADLMNEVVALRLILSANNALQRGEPEQARESATRARSLMPEDRLVQQQCARILRLAAK